MNKKEIATAVSEQNQDKPQWLIDIGIKYFSHHLDGKVNPRKVYKLRFSNLIGGGWCDITLDTKKIGGTQDGSEPVDP